jgi:hypothetical protein
MRAGALTELICIRIIKHEVVPNASSPCGYWLVPTGFRSAGRNDRHGSGVDPAAAPSRRQRDALASPCTGCRGVPFLDRQIDPAAARGRPVKLMAFGCLSA